MRESSDVRTASEFPAAFVERMAALLGAEAKAFLEALAAPPPGLRVNTLRLTPNAFQRLGAFRLQPVPFLAEGFVLEEGEGAGRHPYHVAGLYYLQDPSAMIVGALTGARPGERVLDLAAAPGGKATHLAARMQGAGVLVANDVSRPRAVELARNLERCGVRNALVTAESPERLAATLPGYFDRVLVDAPCSGESMFHKSAAATAAWSPRSVEGCARRQRELMLAAGDLVRPGGTLVYSTCTFASEENEGVVESFLGTRRDFEPARLLTVPGGEPVAFGETSNGEAGSAGSAMIESDPTDTDPAGGGGTGGATAYRLWPHRVPGAGHFVAAMRRTGGPSAHDRVVRPRGAAREPMEALTTFLSGVYSGDVVAPDRVVVSRDDLFELPADAPDLSGLAVVRAGLRLGSVRKARLDPAHALALAVPPDRAVHPLNLELSDPRVSAYLSGLSIRASGPSGWVPILVEGFALGWGKRVGDVVKNHFPKGLRRPHR